MRERVPGRGHRLRAPLLPCRAALSEQLQSAQNGLLMALMESLFKFQPLYRRATAMVRVPHALPLHSCDVSRGWSRHGVVSRPEQCASLGPLPACLPSSCLPSCAL